MIGETPNKTTLQKVASKVIKTDQDKKDIKAFNEVQIQRQKMLKSTITAVKQSNQFAKNAKKIQDYIAERTKSGKPISMEIVKKLEAKIKEQENIVNKSIGKNKKDIHKIVVGGIKAGAIKMKKPLTPKEKFLKEFKEQTIKDVLNNCGKFYPFMSNFIFKIFY